MKLKLKPGMKVEPIYHEVYPTSSVAVFIGRRWRIQNTEGKIQRLKTPQVTIRSVTEHKSSGIHLSFEETDRGYFYDAAYFKRIRSETKKSTPPQDATVLAIGKNNC